MPNIYGAITLSGLPSQTVQLNTTQKAPLQYGKQHTPPQHPTSNARTLSHSLGLAIIRFRSPLLTEYLLLQVLRCFTSPRSPRTPINSEYGDWPQNQPGSPIQAPSDQSPLDDSPRNIAVHHAFHRPLVPRHPPNAQKNNKPNTVPPEEQTKTRQKNLHHRYSHHYTNNNQPTKPHHTTKTAMTMQPARPISPKPDSAPTKTAGNVQCPRASQNQKTQNQHNQNSHALAMLPRKEVIQPHLPVRLPCYDFVPIADPTFDSSLKSLGHRLRVLPTFMT